MAENTESTVTLFGNEHTPQEALDLILGMIERTDTERDSEIAQLRNDIEHMRHQLEQATSAEAIVANALGRRHLRPA